MRGRRRDAEGGRGLTTGPDAFSDAHNLSGHVSSGLRGPLELTASVAAVAATGEVLVSSTVRDLVTAS
jgi:hypothetical protein